MDLRTKATDWMTPRVAVGAYTRDRGNPDAPRLTLEGQSQQWEPPSVAVVDGTRMTRGGDRSGELLLTGQAAALSMQADQWSTPCARDYKGSSEGSMFRTDGKSRVDQMDCQAEQFFHPPSSPDPATPEDGSTCSTAIPNTSPPSVKRKLNPIFVEALMRWPTGLSGFERAEMAWTQWLQLQRPYVFALCSIEDEKPAQGLLL